MFRVNCGHMCVQNVGEEVVWVLTGLLSYLRLLSSAFVGDGSASSLVDPDPPTGGEGLQFFFYLFSAFGWSQMDFTLLAIRFHLFLFVCQLVCGFARSIYWWL